ncbi:MAG: hypothetical protein IBX63_05225 [Coriobacteriia bacterium]|nr:hypothetical protein [Coriobacteriia bacterium]
MDARDRETLSRLARHDGWPAVSIYLPVHRTGPETQQDPIRLKNLLAKAGDTLVSNGMRSPNAEEFLGEAWKLQRDPAFWREGFDGLALFIGEGTFEVIRTSRQLPERLRVDTRFLLRPLMPALSPDLKFYVLALSKKRVRLLEGTAEAVREVDPTGIPQGLADALKYDDYENQVQFHSRTPAAAAGIGRRSAVFHGHGGIGDTEKTDLFHYFRLVDAGLKELVSPDVPLVLAGVDYLFPIYREANTYARLLPEGIAGNPDEQPAREIHAEALSLLEPYLQADVQRAMDAYTEGRGGDTSSADLRLIVPAAVEGRIDTLIVSDEDTAWGSYDSSADSMTLRSEPHNGDIDLLDHAAAATLLHGGTVHVLPAEKVREATGAAAAAVFRY